MTEMIAEKMTTMQSQTETRLEVHADKLVEIKTLADILASKIPEIEKKIAENDAYDKERSRLIEEAMRQSESMARRVDVLEDKMSGLKGWIGGIGVAAAAIGAILPSIIEKML